MTRQQAALAWVWRMNRRRRALTHVAVGPAESTLLLESSGALLLEDGSNLLLE